MIWVNIRIWHFIRKKLKDALVGPINIGNKNQEHKSFKKMQEFLLIWETIISTKDMNKIQISPD